MTGAAIRPTTADPEWWKSSVVYQVYPRSFADSTGDGIGDIRGIIDHLDHVANLGADVLWLSPVYSSPQDDNGYDISDYETIDPLFGTLSDLADLITGLHGRDMKLVMDLVVNHTSDEHAWFTESRASRVNSKADWYIWRDARDGRTGGEPGAEPNNWGSAFSGSAWTWEPTRGQYFLHLFSTKQPDLNWDNPEVRAEIFGMMNRWLDRGIDGFRMDVINFISKDPRLPDGEPIATGFGDAMPHFSYGPHIHDYLAEMKREVFDGRDRTYFTVGEMPGVTPEQAVRFTDAATGQLGMVFQFEHVDLDQDGGKFSLKGVTTLELKTSLGRWQTALGERGWNSLYWNNHDQPRVVSRFGNDSEYWRESATALATVLHLHRGTPYIYQGEELGMTNVPFDDIGDFRDIESLNYYATAVSDGGEDPRSVLEALRRKSRDNARTPMQWSGAPAAGFTAGDPWIAPNPNFTWLNAEAQVGDPDSIYAWYRRLIELRHAEPIVVDGDFRMLLADDPAVYAFVRRTAAGTITVYANLSNSPTPVEMHGDGELVLHNYDGHGHPLSPVLQPWEVRVFRSRALGG